MRRGELIDGSKRGRGRIEKGLGAIVSQGGEEEETRSPGSEMGGDENGDEKETNSKNVGEMQENSFPYNFHSSLGKKTLLVQINCKLKVSSSSSSMGHKVNGALFRNRLPFSFSSSFLVPKQRKRMRKEDASDELWLHRRLPPPPFLPPPISALIERRREGGRGFHFSIAVPLPSFLSPPLQCRLISFSPCPRVVNKVKEKSEEEEEEEEEEEGAEARGHTEWFAGHAHWFSPKETEPKHPRSHTHGLILQ